MLGAAAKLASIWGLTHVYCVLLQHVADGARLRDFAALCALLLGSF